MAATFTRASAAALTVAFGIHIGITGGGLHGFIGWAAFASSWRTLACLDDDGFNIAALAFVTTFGTVLAALTRASGAALTVAFGVHICDRFDLLAAFASTGACVRITTSGGHIFH